MRFPCSGFGVTADVKRMDQETTVIRSMAFKLWSVSSPASGWIQKLGVALTPSHCVRKTGDELFSVVQAKETKELRSVTPRNALTPDQEMHSNSVKNQLDISCPKRIRTRK